MIPDIMEKIEKKRLAILRVLKDADTPLTGARVAEKLAANGVEISERTVRLYLKALEEEGLTRHYGKRGRRITESGLRELAAAGGIEKVGFLSAKIDQMTYRMDFDLHRKSGTLVVNITLVDLKDLIPVLPLIYRVFEERYAMGRLMALFQPGERVDDILVPEGKLGLATVCSITLNGVLLQYGIPTNSRFGGLLEIRNKKPTRFVEIITYDGTSLDPLEVFIRSGMTDYVGAINTGNGRIGASFREFPTASQHKVEEIAGELEEIGLGGLLRVGNPGQPLFDIPVSEGRVGAVVIGGLNPVAVLEETGRRVYSRALAGLIGFDRLFPYTELSRRIGKLAG